MRGSRLFDRDRERNHVGPKRDRQRAERSHEYESDQGNGSVFTLINAGGECDRSERAGGGLFGAGEGTSHGRTAVLVVDARLSIMLTSKLSFTHDPAAFASQCIDVASQDFLVVKRGSGLNRRSMTLRSGPLCMADP